MKPNAVPCLLLIFCVMNLFFGCFQRKAVPLPELERAEAVMFDRPDSALHILESMSMPTDKGQHALWCLLVTQARYKQYLPISSDSLIRIAYDYYKSTDDARRKAMSALYMGDVNYELKNVEEATAYYLEAENNINHIDDNRLCYLVMSGLGNLYLYQNIEDYALEACQKAYDYSVKSGYKRYEMSSLCSLAKCYTLKKEFDKAIELYEHAMSLADSLGLRKFYYQAKGDLSSVYSILGQYEKSLVLRKEIAAHSSFPARFCYGIGINYMNLRQYDSAYYYLNRALDSPNVYTRMGVYKSLLRLSRQPKFQKYLITYSDSLRFYEDSVRGLDKRSEIMVYKEKYEKEKLLTENQQLELEKTRSSRLSLIVIVIALIFSVLYLHRKITLRRKEEELNKLTLQLHKNESLINRNNSYIAELKLQIERKEELTDQQEELAFLHDENERLRKENFRLNEDMKKYTDFFPKTDEIKKIAEQLRRSKQREEDWFAFMQKEHTFLSALHQKKSGLDYAEEQQVYTLVDTLFDKFSKRLTQKVSLTPRELLLCCLIKLRLSVSEIAVLMNLSSSSVSSVKQRIKNKIYGALKIEEPKTNFDLWIWNY